MCWKAGWCNNASIVINGKQIDATPEADAYVCIKRTWNSGDKIEITLPMRLSLRTWDKNKNSVSINYGPLTFSLKIDEVYEQMDSKTSVTSDSKWQPNADQTKWPAYEIYPASMWNYGLILTGQPLDEQFKVVKKQWPADDFPFTQNNVPIMLEAKGKIIPQWTLDKYGLCDTLPQSPVTVSTAEANITLIPMGAARLRISAFPVVK